MEKTPEEIAAEEAATAAAKGEAPADPPSPEDPIKKKLEEVKKPRTEAEKAAYALQKNAERAEALGLDPKKILGIESTPDPSEDDAPVTVGMLKKRDAEKAQKTALQIAESETSDPLEFELLSHYIENVIKPSGNPAEDLANARALVNSVKNEQIAKEVARKPEARPNGSGAGAPAAPPEGVFEPTPEESYYMRPPWNLSKEKILAARKKTAELQ